MSFSPGRGAQPQRGPDPRRVINPLRVRGMALIGSAGRNSGKTVLACQLIQHLKRSGPVVGLKVSTIYGDGRTCLRGVEGCGVCTSLDGAYCLVQEYDPERLTVICS